jgi:outer membrane protein TolC
MQLASAEAPVPDDFPMSGPHSIDEYVAVALDQNPELQATARKVAAATFRIPQAASLDDPQLSLTYLPEEIQTAAGEQRFQLRMSQKVPWKGKRQTRAAVACWQSRMAEAEFAAKELEVVEQVKHAYLDLYFAQEALRILREERTLVEDLADRALGRIKAGNTSQQDFLRAELEVAALDQEIIVREQQFDTAQTRLAAVLHLHPDTKVETRALLPEKEVPEQLDALYAEANAMQPQLQMQAAAIERERWRLELACLERKPDVTASVAWLDVRDQGLSPVANGRDPWLLGLSMNLPIYRQRLNAAVGEASANVAASARQYDAVRDQTLQDVRDLFIEAASQRELAESFRTVVVPTARQTFDVSLGAYRAGGGDFSQLIDDLRQLLRFQLAERRAEVSLRKALASLERSIGGNRLLLTAAPEPIQPAADDDELPEP